MINKNRINKLAQQLKTNNLSGMLICPSEDMLFLTGFTPKMCKRFQALFVTDNGESFFICNLLYKDEVENALGCDLRVYTWRDGESMTEVVKHVLTKYGLISTTLGVNSSAQAFNILEIERDCGINFVNGVPIIEEARIIKNEQELPIYAKLPQ